MNDSAARFVAITPMIPTGGTLAESLAFYTEHLGFAVTWEAEGGAGIVRGGVHLNLVQNSVRAWIDNCSVSIGVSDLDALYAEYRSVPAKVGALEVKSWGRREFHMIVPSGVCLQFYEVNT